MRLLLGLAAGSALLLAGAPLIAIQPASAAPSQCPDTWTVNQCDYYKDGYKTGRQDRKADLSRADERHDGAYDSHHASYYQAGYEAGWSGQSGSGRSNRSGESTTLLFLYDWLVTPWITAPLLRVSAT